MEVINRPPPSAAPERSQQSSTSPRQANSPRKSREEIRRLFEQLQGIYGNQFGSWFATKEQVRRALEEWRYGLGAHSNETISEVVLNLRQNVPHCPRLPEFVGMCKTIRARQLALEAHESAKRAREARRPKTPAEIERGRRTIAELRKVVAG